MPSLASRVAGIEASPTLALVAKAKALRAAGKPVIDFGAGELDFDTPAHIKAAAIRAIEEGLTRYTASAGTPELRQAVCDKFLRDHGLRYDPSCVIVSCGAKHSLFNALQVLCERGDEVLIPSPYWVSYPPLVKLAEGVPVIIPTDERRGFKVEPAALKSRLTPRSKLLILNAPANPTGAVYTQAELAALVEVALAHNLYIISDEIYEQLVYPPHRHTAVASLGAEAAARTITVNGVSKSYAMTGWRIGYCAAPQAIATAMDTLQSHATSNPTSISQRAAVAALTGPQECVAEFRRELAARRDLMVEGLRQIPGLSCESPAGAFYVFCNVSGVGDGSRVAQRWLEECGIMVIPGDGFGASAYVRFSFATSREMIRRGLGQLEQWSSAATP
ncbi:MAG: pyridoxal phosphate-dependent aminotransferase [Candidatus Omnitrophica bacterium]|nr:pyridoxal phosphate-dependent aminotransferase [Candidatus Omnitrophota bacterium]